jgi:hypothetical protein
VACCDADKAWAMQGSSGCYIWYGSTNLDRVITLLSEVAQMMGVKLAGKVKKMAGEGEMGLMLGEVA